MAIGYVKQTASGKTEQSNANCDGKTKTLLQILGCVAAVPRTRLNL